MNSFALSLAAAPVHAVLHVGDATYDSGGGGNPIYFSDRITRPYVAHFPQ